VSATSLPGRHAPARIDGRELEARVVEALDRWPSAGLAVGVVRDGSLAWFLGHGVADAASKEPVTEDTVFRVGSISKTFTAIAVMQLAEQGSIDLDAPASDYLRSFRLVPARASFRPATVRHFLTHTAGIGYWRRASDLLRPALGAGDRAPRSGALPLADYYRAGLPIEVEPGTKWTYTNHGFATLGQIVEDVSGRPLDRYLRDHVFEPLRMEHTDLIRSERVRTRLATGYVLRAGGLTPVADRDVPTPGAAGIYSTPGDMALYVAALLRGGTGDHGSVLGPATLASMLRPSFQPDPRVPGWGLGFELGEEGGHRIAGHTGVLSGFLSAFLVAPDDGAGVVAFSNTGGLDGRGAPDLVASAVLRRVLGLPAESTRADIPARPDAWNDICGWYAPDPGPITNLFVRAVLGAGAEVTVRGGHLMLKALTPVPGMRKGLRLHPDDPSDPLAFRVDLSDRGKAPVPVVFGVGSGAGAPAPQLHMLGMTLTKRPDVRNPRPWVMGALVTGATAVAARRCR
jgi:CubicO group peptidase (beta-lactamase class C family)